MASSVTVLTTEERRLAWEWDTGHGLYAKQAGREAGGPGLRPWQNHSAPRDFVGRIQVHE